LLALCWEDNFSAGERLALMRYALLHVWETHLLVSGATKAYPAVDEFVTELGQKYPGELAKGQDLVRALRGGTGATAPTLREVMRVARLTVAHYPMPGDERLAVVLSELGAENIAAVVEYDATMESARATFADEIAHGSSTGDLDEEDWRSILEHLTTSDLAIIHLADTAIALRHAARTSVDPMTAPSQSQRPVRWGLSIAASVPKLDDWGSRQPPLWRAAFA
jgi:hypothetical protein